MIELLSPAGDEEKMRVAFNYGADAVYFGGQNYSLRANAKNFNNEEIKNAVILAHGLNKKVYVTVNIIFHDEDFEGLEEYLKYLEKRELSLKEKVLLVRLKKELLDLLEEEKKQDEKIGYQEELHEQKLEVPLRHDIEVIFTGTVDKILYYKKIEDTYFAIIDYKTGNVDTKLEKMKYGLSMQLPIYLFLINY